ncbi:MAG: hypothetical protein HGA31_02695 [Candidatus Moranbacteria bacterium]|nr:hypothetical protein [Candidatus Moranbacteria bacterium]
MDTLKRMIADTFRELVRKLVEFADLVGHASESFCYGRADHSKDRD